MRPIKATAIELLRARVPCHGLSGPAVDEGRHARAVVLVEGISDQARARGARPSAVAGDLAAEGVSDRADRGRAGHRKLPGSVRSSGLDVRLAGLCDAGEEGDFRRGLERAGLGSNLTRADMERLGFYVCVADLEDELSAALGAAAVEQVVDAQGDLGSFRTLQKQPAWQGRADRGAASALHGQPRRPEDPVRAFARRRAGSHPVPRPLDRVLATRGRSRRARSDKTPQGAVRVGRRRPASPARLARGSHPRARPGRVAEPLPERIHLALGTAMGFDVVPVRERHGCGVFHEVVTKWNDHARPLSVWAGGGLPSIA